MSYIHQQHDTLIVIFYEIFLCIHSTKHTELLVSQSHICLTRTTMQSRISELVIFFFTLCGFFFFVWFLLFV